MEITSLSLTESDAQIFLRGVPDSGRAPLTAQQLREWVAEQGFADCMEVPGGLKAASNECNTAAQPFVVQVLQRRNAEVLVPVAKDEMSATILITAPPGGNVARE